MIETDPDRIPDRSHARRLVVSLAMFWVLWGVAVGCSVTGAPGALLVFAFVAGIGSCLFFYGTFFHVWQEEPGVSPWRLAFLSWRWTRNTRDLMRNLYRPRWIRATLRATGWPAAPLAGGLLGLLLVDLVLFVLLMGHSHPR